MKTKTLLLCLTLIFSSLPVASGQESKDRGGAVRLRVEAKTGDAAGEQILVYENSYALLIGNSLYHDQRAWGDLPGVEEDIVAVRKVLEEEHGFKVEVALNQKREAVLRVIDQFISRYGQRKKNRLLFYYAGHGYTALHGGRKMGFIVMPDASPMPPESSSLRVPPSPEEFEGFLPSAITMAEIEAYAEKRIQSDHVLFVFDSCFSGTAIYRSSDVTVSDQITTEELLPVRAYLTAGNETQRVPDFSKFRHKFVAALHGAADGNGDGYITGYELWRWVSVEVEKETGRRQTPVYGKSKDDTLHRGDVIFASPKGASAPGYVVRAPALPPGQPGAGGTSGGLDVVTAQAILDRAMKAGDGSMQGQVQAIETLLARGHEFSNNDMNGVSLRGANVSRGVFKGARFNAADLREVVAGDADFGEAAWRFTNVEKAQFHKAKLVRIYAPFLWGKDAAFDGADLTETNFYSSDLRGADFSNTKLHGTSFAFADLRGAKFDGADLTGAFFVGALLDGTTFVGATLGDTDFTGAVSDNFLLSPKQKEEVCRRVIDFRRWVPEMVVSTGTRGKRHGSNITIESLNNFDDASLPLCRAPLKQRKENTVRSSFAGGYELISLHADYASKAGRTKAFVERMTNHRQLLVESLLKTRVLKGDGAQRKSWDTFMRAAVKNTAPISKPYLNADLMLVYLLSKKLVDAEQVSWKDFAYSRYTLEANIHKNHDENVAGHSMWPKLFPPNAPWKDLPADTVELFKTWTLARVMEAPKVFTITRRFNHHGWEDEGGKHKNTTLQNQDLIDTDGGSALSDSGSRHGVPYKLLNIEDERVTNTPNVEQLMSTAFVWQDHFDNYYLKIPTGLFEEGVNLELDINIESVEPISQDGKQTTVIFMVSHGEARLLSKENKVIWTGNVRIGEDPAWKREKRQERAAMEQREWDNIKDGINPHDFRAFLMAFPKGANASSARSRLKALTSGGIPASGNLVPWLEGLWEGSAKKGGYEGRIILDARSSRYFVQYPTPYCSGEWILVEKGVDRAVFTENFEYPNETCVNGGRVVLERRGGAQISYQYFAPNTRTVADAAVLDKK